MARLSIKKSFTESSKRKELRKLKKKVLKKKPDLPRQIKDSRTSDNALARREAAASLDFPGSNPIQIQTSKTKKAKDVPDNPEDKELKRLEKLLGIQTKKEKKAAIAKLNKEYELYEGIGGDFGDFLMKLDDLDRPMEYDHAGSKLFNDDHSWAEKLSEDGDFCGLLQDDEMEKSDIENDDFDDNIDEVSVMDEYLGEERESLAPGSESEDDQSDIQAVSGKEQLDKTAGFTYHPSSGQDIYGRQLEKSLPSQMSRKYVPPARRAIESTLDETSEPVQILRRSFNGLMNRLSEQSKDSICRAIKSLFETNSLSVCNIVLRDCVIAACGNTTQTMTTLIPVYSSIIAALHFSIGIEVGAFMVESVVLDLIADLQKPFSSLSSHEHSHISSKRALNLLLLILYLYNMRVLHHRLVMDIMDLLAGETSLPPVNDPDGSSSTCPRHAGVPSAMEVEMLLCIVDNCGWQLRSDDPDGLKRVVNVLTRNNILTSHQKQQPQSLESSTLQAEDRQDGDELQTTSRLRFMMESLLDLKNNKSKRVQSVNKEAVQCMRKWLGSAKALTSESRGGHDACLRVSLRDLLDADKRGRWWRAGASWAGNTDDVRDEVSAGRATTSVLKVKAPQNADGEEAKLMKLAEKLRFNTSTRRSIFIVTMSSRDVFDAYERLSRLELKGKSDREVVRVLFECCGAEKAYNPFYAELLALFCKNNRQSKTTLQFAFYDFFKVAAEDEEDVPQRRAVNLARLLSHLVGTFDVPLSLLKRLDMAALNGNMILFLATFFIGLFTNSKIPEDTFQSILDRVATTKDYATVRDNIVFFLQRHLAKTPAGLPAEDTKLMNRRRKQTVRSMEAMTVLDIPRAAFEEEQARV